MYSGLGSIVETQKLEYNIEIGGYTKKNDKNNFKKKAKDYSYRVRLEKLGLPTLQERRMQGDPIVTFKIINGISNYGRHFFNISPQAGNLMSKKISETKFTNQLDFFAKSNIA